jgi:hypothetical protein
MASVKVHIPHQYAIGDKMAGAGATYIAPLYLIYGYHSIQPLEHR